MNINKLTNKERKILSLINENRKKPIKCDKMPKQEVYTHLYGWDNPHIDINLLLTPKEKLILIDGGHKITNELKANPQLLDKVRNIRKSGEYQVKKTFTDWIRCTEKKK